MRETQGLCAACGLNEGDPGTAHTSSLASDLKVSSLVAALPDAWCTLVATLPEAWCTVVAALPDAWCTLVVPLQMPGVL